MAIETIAHARAGLLGNPSDGYHGKVIAVPIKDYSARVRIDASPSLRLCPPSSEKEDYRDAGDLASSLKLYGYYGDLRLVKAAIKVFMGHCTEQGIDLRDKNFTLSYESDIPRQVGLGGSSAIVVASLKALAEFYDVAIPLEAMPSLALAAEKDELGINAGYMDRVAQAYDSCVYMDLDKDLFEERGFGEYVRLDPGLFPPLYLAVKPELGKVSGQALSSIRAAFDRGEEEVRQTLDKIASLAARGREALSKSDHRHFGRLMDENFDLRSRIMPISEENRALILAARGCGASAKFAGSGGSIIGTYEGPAMLEELAEKLGGLGARVIKPSIA